ncbi:MAG: TIGR04084 family radical SAM/SPASM domain-containing protein [Candidatus Heimdallarchaeaceae archaeon]
MNWFIITSNDCNLRCAYCLNEPHPDLPVSPNWDIKELKLFLENDKNPDIAFYGGEPLLELKLIERIMDEISVNHFTLQTNGILLHKLKTNYLKRIASILISIDGNKKITESNRGFGIFDKIKQNIHNIRGRGFTGDLIARMAVSEVSDIYQDVLFLLNDEDLTFDHVHWQLDCQWDYDMSERWNDFPKWVEEYNKGITKLVSYWLDKMRGGEVKGIVPFLGVFRNILNDAKTDLPCEAGLRSFAIRTDGIITFCPLPPEFEKTIVGDIRKNKSEELQNSAKIENSCLECEVFDLCGGRCLFANLYKLWGEEGFNLVCKTVKHLVSELKGIRKEVEELIEKGIIKRELLDYPEYNNTTEIIP